MKPCCATVLVLALAPMLTGAPLAADEVKGDFHFGKVRFTPSDALAYTLPGKDPAKPMTVVLLTDFKIDRADAAAAIDTAGALFSQIVANQRGNVVILAFESADKCAVSGFLGETAQNISLGTFPARTKGTSASRAVGECGTAKPGKMFEDTYDFKLSFDVPTTAIPAPTPVPAGGGEPGAAYLALAKAIQAANFSVARLHLPEDQIPTPPPSPRA